METKPNIFDYATSELSQDAFLAWLIQWADKGCQKFDSSLHACATSFVQALLGEKPCSIETVEVKTQWKNIDVCASVNQDVYDQEYFIIIEDKKGTEEHSDQLNRYLDIVKTEYNNLEIDKIKPVYFKMEEQGDYSKVEEAEFVRFPRSDMLSILEGYISSTEQPNQNDIIVDYYNNLKDLDEKIESYKKKPLDDWYWYSWQGFYSALQEKIEKAHWGYVSNPSGGFLGFWWPVKEKEFNGKKYYHYLQIEENKFCFKLELSGELDEYSPDLKREIRDHHRQQVFAKAEDHGIQVEKSGRIGKSMTVAILSDDYRKCDKDGLIDMDKTIEEIKKIEKMVDSI